MKARDFYEKGKGSNYMVEKEGISVGANKLSYSLVNILGGANSRECPSFSVLIVRLSVFLSALQAVVWKIMLLWPGPKVILPSSSIQRFEEYDMQGCSSGMAAPTPF